MAHVNQLLGSISNRSYETGNSKQEFLTRYCSVNFLSQSRPAEDSSFSDHEQLEELRAARTIS